MIEKNLLRKSLLESHKIKTSSRYTSRGAVFAERFSRTLGNLLIEPVFEESGVSWLVFYQVIQRNKT